MRPAVLLLLWAALAAAAEAVVAVRLDGTIDGTAVSLVQTALADAEARGLPLLVVLDTYGGYLAPMDQIVDALLRARVPVYAYVPVGGKAMSAGAYIAMAAQRLYMDPTAEIGAAEPRPPDPKAVNYAAGRMRALASRHWNDSRVDLAVSFVTENRVLTGAEAVRLGMAQPPQAWTYAAEYRRDPLAQLLNALSDPTLVTVLILLGVILIGHDLLTAGFQGTGVVGAILVVLALYLLGQLGLPWLVAALALGAAAMLAAEVKVGHGGLAAAGLAMFALATYMAWASQPYLPPTPLSYILAGTGAAAALGLAAVGIKVRRALRRKPPDLRGRLLGKRGYAKTDIVPGRYGVAYVEGEEWTAVSDVEIREGQPVIVEEVEGFVVRVKPLR